MIRVIIVALLAASIPAVATDDPGDVSITYEVASVNGKLILGVEPDERRLAEGDDAVSGDRLRTGSSSSAIIGAPSHTAVFRLDSKTTCTLAHDRPGVLLHVERGRLRAMFGSYTGSDPRLVTTPSAVLAVRGTEYGVRVKKNGETRIVVFEGVVELADPAGEHPPVRLEAGEQSRIRVGRPAEAPTPHRFTPNDWDYGPGSTGPRIGQPGSAPGTGSGSTGSSGAGSGKSGSGAKRRGG
jgi:hypothetical protein